ncbi:MAG: hypothetical protein IKO07_00380 [Clostridia bacterium]|nr:hypothetical protein [Clostridia bacterium]
MNGKKIGLAALAVVLGLALLLLLAGAFQNLLIVGARLAQGIGDTVVPDEEQETGWDEAEPSAAPAATWPPGDDPSWSEDMPLAPVDKTADELAEEMKGSK